MSVRRQSKKEEARKARKGKKAKERKRTIDWFDHFTVLRHAAIKLFWLHLQNNTDFLHATN